MDGKHATERERIVAACRAEDAQALLAVAVDAAERSGNDLAHEAMLALAGAVSVEMSREHETAWISRAPGGFRLRFNAEFFAAHHRLGEEVLHTVLHELLHRVHGHLRRSADRGNPRLANFVCDLLVNRDLWQTIFKRGLPYFSALYPRDTFPACLLLPPDLLLGMDPEDVEGLSDSDFRDGVRGILKRNTGLASPVASAASTAFAGLWRGDVSYEWLERMLSAVVPAGFDVILIGGHGLEEDDDPEWAALRRQLEALLGLEGGYAETEEVHRVDVRERPVDVLADAIRRVVAPDIRAARGVAEEPLDRGVVPYLGRREAFLISAGVWPVLFPSRLPSPADDGAGVRLYVDVSDSTRQAWGALYGMVLRLRNEVAKPFFVFSNVVRPITLFELKEGVVRTTGGTDFDCLVEHSLRQRFRKILVVTDGHAELDDGLARRLRDTGVAVYEVLTARNNDSGLRGVAKQSWTLPRDVLAD